MATELAHLIVHTEQDLLKLHDLSMQLGDWAGLSPIERINFAAEIAAHSHTPGNEAIKVGFSIEENENKASIRVQIQNHSRTLEKRIYQAIKSVNLPPFNEIHEQKIVDSDRGYKDMQQFTFALAHDLKNSLTKLKLALSLVEDEEMTPVMNSYIRIISRAAERLETIMLSLNKIIQLGDSSPDVVKKISPAMVFADVHEEFAETLSQKEAMISTDFSAVNELNYIEVYLKSIFTNLLSNAIKYSSSHRALRLSVSAYRDNGKAAFLFSDNGQGIDLEATGNKLFQPFTRFSNSSEGSGIGLYLIKNIVERNGGKISVESTPGEGTTFRFVLEEYKLPVTS